MHELHFGDCLEIMPTLPDASIDAVIADPPYPEIDRDYGRMTEAKWHDLMHGVVAECRRVLKPTGSAVFVLQPNSRTIGSMRLWPWEFMVWAGREWNIIQDAYWWNISALPQTKNDPNRLRASLKACVWLGPPDCYHDASGVRWAESDLTRAKRLANRCEQSRNINSGANIDRPRIAASTGRNNGVTPFNVLPIPTLSGPASAGAHGHGAGTPPALCNWWVRYICPPGGVVLDPFMGVGTVGLEALNLGRSFVGIEKHEPYFATCRERFALTP